jgi:hypothetical protein
LPEESTDRESSAPRGDLQELFFGLFYVDASDGGRKSISAGQLVNLLSKFQAGSPKI